MSYITGGKYGSLEIRDDLEIILDASEKKIALDILSSGTLDSVALAFRLALIEEMSHDDGTITVLDDCLVNMDPERQKNAVELIKRHGQKHQVIFTTCNPEICQLLGGSQIILN